MPFITRDYLSRFVGALTTIKAQALRNRSNEHYKSQSAPTKKMIFLSHSHKDKDLVEQVALFLLEQGSDVYVDWKDSSMPERTSKETANNIKERIKSCDEFVVLASNRALDSKWVPWELGFADAAKGMDSIFIFPVAENDGVWNGSEYFGLYQKILLGRKDTSSVHEAMVKPAHLMITGKSLKTALRQGTDMEPIYDQR